MDRLQSLSFDRMRGVFTGSQEGTRGVQGQEKLEMPDVGPATGRPAPATLFGQAFAWLRRQVSAFSAVLSDLVGRLLGKQENAAATGAQLGAARGGVYSKGAVLGGHVMDAQASYASAKKDLTTSIAYAESEGKPTFGARDELVSFDRRAEQIFENIGNRHRSSKSRQNQRAKLADLASEMRALAGRIDG